MDGPLGVYGKQHLTDLGEFIDPVELIDWDNDKRADAQTRGCCGGRKMCFDRQLRKTNTMVPRGPDGFKGWHCSANQFFLHGNNITGKYFTNRDCHVKVDGTTGHIADINTMPDYIANMKKQQQLPTLVCAQTKCVCGTCAPKSVHPGTLKEIMKIYNTVAN